MVHVLPAVLFELKDCSTCSFFRPNSTPKIMEEIVEVAKLCLKREFLENPSAGAHSEEEQSSHVSPRCFSTCFNVERHSSGAPCCFHTDMSAALEWYRHGENEPVSNPIAVMAFSLATSQHCAASFVPHMAVSRTAYTLASVAFAWHLDHNSATCRAGKMCSTEAINPRTLTSAGASRLPVMHRLSMNLRLSSGGVAAHVLLASSGVNSRTLLVSCAKSRARTNGFAASPLFVDPSSSDGIEPRLVQIAHKNFKVNLYINSSLIAPATIFGSSSNLLHVRFVQQELHGRLAIFA